MQIKNLLLVCIMTYVCKASDLHISVHAQKTEKTPIGLVYVGALKKSDNIVLQRLQKDLQYSGQCSVHVKHFNTIKNSLHVKKSFPQNVYVMIFVSKSDDYYQWRLHDMISHELLAENQLPIADYSTIGIAHALADQMWPQLMGSSSSFSSKIAYCKQIWKNVHGQDKPYKQIWIADFDGTNQKLFVDVPTVSFAPRWSMQTNCPLLFYSENTLSNVQLVMSNMFKKRQVMCCFDGLNMQPTFSSDGQEVVFCLSKDGSSQLYHSYVDGLSKKRTCQRLTHNDANNIAPCFIDKNHVAFVSDYETMRPQLYVMRLSDKSMTRITQGGYCACPCYSPVTHQIVYSKMIDGAMQLCTYDCKIKQHMQLTSGSGSKEEPSWSACGNYIVFGLNDGLHSRIAQLHIATNKIRYITGVKQHCTYPAYSPVYQKQLGILKA
ncbi:MAG: hypothetical protein CL947_02875 [Epsilonproteobacteria bacterium]|nr:hypothetical protein [Campylobacterota bacterium]